MSKAIAIIGIVLGAIVTGGLAGLGIVAGGIAIAGLSVGTTAGIIGGTIGVLTVAGGTLSTVAGWSGGGGGSSISSGSPTYSWGKLQTQTSNCLAIPIIYGKVKVAGNTIWQNGSGTATLKRIIALCDGEIEEIKDVKLNNKAINSISGCLYNGYLGTSSQAIDSRVTGSTNLERAKLVGGLKNTAYVAITAKAGPDLSGGVNLTTIVKGSKIKVYSDLENYEIKYSNNPAWCLLDFLTNYHACAMPLSEIDLQSFIESAQYCDQPVDGQPRFTMNIILDERRSRLEWIDSMLMTCRGYISYQAGKLSMRIEKAEDSTQVFTPDNILAGSERFWTTPREKRADIFKVQFIDPENEYAKIFASAEATLKIVGKNNPPEKVKEFTVFQKGDMLKAVIIPPDDLDIEKYEIRKGLFWSDSEFVCSFSDKTTMFKPDEVGTVSYLIKAIDNVGNYADVAARAQVNVTGLTPKNVIVEKAFTKTEFLDGGLINENPIKEMPVIDLGLNFQDYRLPKETYLTCDIGSAEKINVEYRSGFANFQGWDFLSFDEDTWEDEAQITWSEWKSAKLFPEFAGQYLQARIYATCPRGEVNDVEKVNIIADVEDIEDTIYNVDVAAQKTTVRLNKRFMIIPTIIPTTADDTGKTCAWRISDVQTNCFDIELFDSNDNLTSGKILSATARGY